jgi:hypothetical protein
MRVTLSSKRKKGRPKIAVDKRLAGVGARAMTNQDVWNETTEMVIEGHKAALRKIMKMQEEHGEALNRLARCVEKLVVKPSESLIGPPKND